MEHPHGASPSLLPRIPFDGRVDEYTEGVELQNARSRDSRHGNRIYRKPQAAAKLPPFTFFVYSSFLSGEERGCGVALFSWRVTVPSCILFCEGRWRRICLEAILRK
ncbi:hypothetical protein TNCV_4696041 [Trichonephila clavipes]|nr:hypothetical protein TNCV_4696041 [Trichonephila clavipes]